MRKLSPNLEFDLESLRERILNLTPAREDFNPKQLRNRIEENYGIERIKPRLEGEAGFLSVDSSIVCKELRYKALWATHSISLYGVFDGKMHPDSLAGGSTLYGNLMYDSTLNLGEFIPYRQIEERKDILRIKEELQSFLNSAQEIKSSGKALDYLLMDGSLNTVFNKISRDETLLCNYQELLTQGKVIGMVEDSASIDITTKLGLGMTNLALFDMILDEGEYIIDRKDSISVCYIKLPSKKLSYSTKKSLPLVVRWEFAYPEFYRDLELLVGIWLQEEDLFHPQLYSLRIADYLTRKAKVSGILDQLVKGLGLELKYRDRREV